MSLCWSPHAIPGMISSKLGSPSLSESQIPFRCSELWIDLRGEEPMWPVVKAWIRTWRCFSWTGSTVRKISLEVCSRLVTLLVLKKISPGVPVLRKLPLVHIHFWQIEAQKFVGEPFATWGMRYHTMNQPVVNMHVRNLPLIHPMHTWTHQCHHLANVKTSRSWPQGLFTARTSPGKIIQGWSTTKCLDPQTFYKRIFIYAKLRNLYFKKYK